MFRNVPGGRGRARLLGFVLAGGDIGCLLPLLMPRIKSGPPRWMLGLGIAFLLERLLGVRSPGTPTRSLWGLGTANVRKKWIRDFSDSYYCARDGGKIQEWAFGLGQ